MAAMFDPVYVTEVFNDILGRRGLQVKLIPKNSAGASPGDGQEEGEKLCPQAQAAPRGAAKKP